MEEKPKSIEKSLESIDNLSDAEVLALAAEGQDILSEGTLVSPLVYRKLAQLGLEGNIIRSVN